MYFFSNADLNIESNNFGSELITIALVFYMYIRKKDVVRSISGRPPPPVLIV